MVINLPILEVGIGDLPRIIQEIYGWDPTGFINFIEASSGLIHREADNE